VRGRAQRRGWGTRVAAAKHPMIRSASRQQDEGMDNRSSEHTGDRVGAQMRREGTDEAWMRGTGSKFS